jgi:hypothetical protein
MLIDPTKSHVRRGSDISARPIDRQDIAPARQETAAPETDIIAEYRA